MYNCDVAQSWIEIIIYISLLPGSGVATKCWINLAFYGNPILFAQKNENQVLNFLFLVLIIIRIHLPADACTYFSSLL